MKKFIRIILLVLIIVSFSYILCYLFDTYKTKKESNILDNIIASENTIIEKNVTNIEESVTNEPNISESKIEEPKPERVLKVEELKNQNSDIIGWIEIENTAINYPVLQCSDNKFYMNHNYKKEKSKNGAIFLDKDYNWNIPSNNLLIYGHNMKNNTMFQHLLKYKSEKFYKQHPIIRFTTANEDAYFEIISVFESRVYYKSEKNVFRYYYFINPENETQYNEYIQNAKKASLYDTKKTAVYGDQLITLSTCSYHVKDGRFVVVAKKIAT